MSPPAHFQPTEFTTCLLKSKCRNTEKRVVAVNIADSQAEGVVAAEHLQGIKKVVEAIWRYIIVCKCHESDLAGVHPRHQMRMGNCEQLYCFWPATGITV